MKANGIGGQVSIEGDTVVIRRKGTMGFILHPFKGDKAIQIASITSIQMRLGGLAVNGFIQFSFGGGNESRGSVLAATKDENSVMFSMFSNDEFQNLKTEIENRMAVLRSGSCSSVAIASSVSVADELERLAALRDKGILSNDEFAAEKAKLLGRK